MGRVVLGVVVGFVVWSVMWVGGNQLVFGEAVKKAAAGEMVTDVPTLLGLLVQSVVCSLVSGAVCGLIARKKAAAASLALGVVLLGVGVVMQAMAWELNPVWYHLSFLGLLVPVTVAGGMVVRGAAS